MTRRLTLAAAVLALLLLAVTVHPAGCAARPAATTPTAINRATYGVPYGGPPYFADHVPVPEPAAYGLIGAAVLFGVVLRRRSS